MPRRILLTALTLTIFLSATPLRAQEPVTRPAIETADIDALLGTEWFGVYVQGKKVGWAKTIRARDTAAGDISEMLEFSIKVTSFGQKSEMTFSQSAHFENKPPYRLISGQYSTASGGSKKSHLIVNRGQQFEVVSTNGNETTKRMIPALDFTFGDSMAAEVWVRRQPKAGDSILYNHIDLSEIKIEKETSTVLSSKVSLVNGAKVKFYEIKTLSSAHPVETLNRYDEKGRLLSLRMSIFEFRLETEEQAKDTEYSQDLFVLGQVKVNRTLGDPDNVAGLVLEVSGDQGNLLPSGPRQSIAPKGNVQILKLGKRYGVPSRASEKDVADNLQETNDLPITHRRIKELAREAVGDAKTDAEKVQRLVRFVHNYVRPTLTASLPNIFDLLDKKKGDCKSYALLFNALARASGVPSRGVSGLLYVGDDSKSFGGHAWNEVVINGEWVPVDAAMNEMEINATHICFGDETRSTGNMLATLGKLSFRVVEIERGD